MLSMCLMESKNYKYLQLVPFYVHVMQLQSFMHTYMHYWNAADILSDKNWKALKKITHNNFTWPVNVLPMYIYIKKTDS